MKEVYEKPVIEVIALEYEVMTGDSAEDYSAYHENEGDGNPRLPMAGEVG